LEAEPRGPEEDVGEYSGEEGETGEEEEEEGTGKRRNLSSFFIF